MVLLYALYRLALETTLKTLDNYRYYRLHRHFAHFYYKIAYNCNFLIKCIFTYLHKNTNNSIMCIILCVYFECFAVNNLHICLLVFNISQKYPHLW